VGLAKSAPIFVRNIFFRKTINQLRPIIPVRPDTIIIFIFPGKRPQVKVSRKKFAVSMRILKRIRRNSRGEPEESAVNPEKHYESEPPLKSYRKNIVCEPS
jgi:hypothetical protein